MPYDRAFSHLCQVVAIAFWAIVLTILITGCVKWFF
jgi:hypothetical protein